MKKLHFVLSASILLLNCQLTHAKGWIDIANYDHFAGWACKQGSSQIVDIHIYASGHLIGSGTAGNIRESAVQAVCGSSLQTHGFDIWVSAPAALRDGTLRDVIIYAIYEDGSHEKLDNTPIKVLFPAAPGQVQRPQQFGDIVGRDLGYSWAGPLNYFGHIGIWDGIRVIEATGLKNGDDTLKLTPWSSYVSDPTTWRPISPVTARLRHSYCAQSICPMSELANGDLTPIGSKTSHLREMAAKSAYVKYLIGARYTVLATWSPSKQGIRYNTRRHCNPFSTSCHPRLVETKAVQGVYRCETFALDVWGSTSTVGSYQLVGQKVAPFESTSDVQRWGKQIQFLTSPIRIRTPKDTYDNFQRQWW
jgi:hypothetical protein